MNELIIILYSFSVLLLQDFLFFFFFSFVEVAEVWFFTEKQLVFV